MKIQIFIVSILILSFLQLSAQQDYYVTVVRGEIFKQNNIKVEVGDKLLSTDKLIFKSPGDFLILLNSKGRYIVSIEKDNAVKPNELMSILITDHIQLQAKNIRLSSRSIDYPVSLSAYFSPLIIQDETINNKILIADTLKIPIQNMGYDDVDNSENFFFLQLIDTNGNGLSKRLYVQNDTLFLTKQDFIFNEKLYSSTNGTLIIGLVKNYSTEKQINTITNISPDFVSKSELFPIANAIKSSLAGASKEILQQELYTELYYFYGKPNEELLNELLQTE